MPFVLTLSTPEPQLKIVKYLDFFLKYLWWVKLCQKMDVIESLERSF